MAANVPNQLTELPGFRDFAAHLDDVAIFSGDESGFHYMSPGFENIWGIPVEDVLDDIWVTIERIHPEDRDRVQETLNKSDEPLSRGERVEVEHRVIRPDDEIRWVETRMFPVHDDDGNFMQVVGVAIDITERKRVEQALEVQNKRLERFAETVSHDLRTPLTTATGYLELVAADVEHEYIENIDRSLERMGRMIDQVLTLARTGDGDIPTETVDLHEVITGAGAAVAADDSSITIADELGALTADEELLKRLLENLFRNAIEHVGPSVSITVGSSDDRSGFYVADDGPGIPPSDREEIFEAGVSSAEDGAGLGLAIASEVCELHGWDITVGESHDGGARFEIGGIDLR